MWSNEWLDEINVEEGGVSISFPGNLPFCEKSVYILFISSKTFGVFKLSFDILIKCSVETFHTPMLMITLLYILFANVLAWY